MYTYNPIAVVSANALASATTGDKAVLTVPYKCKLKRAFVVVEGASVNAVAAVIKFDIRPIAGSDTNRTDGTAGVISKAASVNQQGKYLYEDPATLVTLSEGQQVVVEVTTANGDALAFTGGILVEYIPERPGNNSAMASA